MVDFLKAFPFVTMEDYKWKLSVPMIRLMAIDNTHINYLSEKQVAMKNTKVVDGNDEKSIKNDFGMVVLGSDHKDGESGLESD